MAEITEEIDFTKLIPKITLCKIYGIFMLCLKPYNSYIQLGEAFMDFIHSDILGPFKIRLNGS
jgi:hypothetical protein